ncbi:type II toxin-antitoxin system PemK/MazF family toxin [Companilactobacillus mishanensis]|uniref:Type II toxin-antitoxin system PemK/MazF family toxin n=1 Tax=Companilactobacillus mishanensis TaxID=2486008 RepID=A0A5P0ZHN8_9LACO|nr:type II toxin-antitoxin system PemK/MazF family toxin [Companilactobacillus mishanensis]MQS52580.1 type II toxin-antitoxin system PemK/MazF family toxin [Companilactobacillus mishanensis]
MAYQYNGYTPKQGDLIYLNFDPTVGREITKRRPALIMSSTRFNEITGYITICPITSTIRNNPLFLTLHAKKLHGQINTIQFRTVDFLSNNRDVEFVEKCAPIDFMKTAESITNGFDFNSQIDNL